LYKWKICCKFTPTFNKNHFIMKSFFWILVFTFTSVSSMAISHKLNCSDTLNFNVSKFREQLKLSYSQPQSKFNLQNYGVTPYLFCKYIPGTGEKFAMAGMYVNVYQNKIKLNLNNISNYMFTSTPWALISLNIEI